MRTNVRIFLFFIIGIGMVAMLGSKISDLMPFQGIASAASDQQTVHETEPVILHVEGMTCRKCVRPIQKALLRIPGVKKAAVSYSQTRAVVECEKGKVADRQLVKAIEEQSNFFYTYKAKVVNRE